GDLPQSRPGPAQLLLGARRERRNERRAHLRRKELLLARSAREPTAAIGRGVSTLVRLNPARGAMLNGQWPTDSRHVRNAPRARRARRWNAGPRAARCAVHADSVR